MFAERGVESWPLCSPKGVWSLGPYVRRKGCGVLAPMFAERGVESWPLCSPKEVIQEGWLFAERNANAMGGGGGGGAHVTYFGGNKVNA